MELTSSQSGDIQVVKVNEARIDAAVAIQFKDAVRSETEGGAGRVVLDLSEVAFIDSSGLGAIVAAMKQMGGNQKLDLAGLTPAVDKVFRLTRMDTVFAIYDSTDAALLAKTGT
ncbi:STAS domain-containing protein [Roseobacteraceae bacterium S113]